MILHIKPVPHILSPAIDRQRPAIADVVDKQRNQLLRKLVRSIVVGAIGHHHRHPVSVVEGTDEMVGGRLRRRIWTVR